MKFRIIFRNRIFRAAVLPILFFSLLSAQGYGQEEKKSPIFDALKTNFHIMGWVDLSVSYMAIEKNWAGEKNAIARFYLNQPFLAVASQVATNVAVSWLSDRIYKDNKTLGFIALGVFTLIRGWILYNNFKIIRDHH